MKSIFTEQKNMDMVKVISNIIELKPKGHYYMGLCPFHQENTPSMKVSHDSYKCFGCGASGDLIDFLHGIGKTNKEIESIFYEGDVPVYTPEKKQISPTEKWVRIKPEDKPTSFTHPVNGEPDSIYTYYREDGSLYGYICRFNLSNGKKDVIPLVYAIKGKVKRWRWQGFDNNAPLYNINLLTKYDTSFVLVVEGEKAADAGIDLFPEIPVITWHGGSNAYKKSNWESIKDRNIILWADNDISFKYGKFHEKAGEIMSFPDQPGNKVMINIHNILQPFVKSIKFVRNHPKCPDKWDIADTKDSEKVKSHMKANLLTYDEFVNIR